MKTLRGISLLLLLLAGCASQPPASTPQSAPKVDTGTPAAPPQRFNGPGHDYTNAIQFSGVSNPLAFSQKQQEWLWLHYRDWKKIGQAMRDKNGIRFDEVTLLNVRGEKRVIYFRMPATGKAK